ncbi:probable F-actin-capping protein subunit beta [Tanacetum coccineum]
MEGAMGLMRRMPPKHTQTALSALLSLLPDHSSDLLSQIDQPLQVVKPLRDGLVAKGLVNCDYHFKMCEVSSSIPASYVRVLYSVAFGLLNDQSEDFGFGEVARDSFVNDPSCVWGLVLCVLCDDDSGKEFILCEYNRDADSYRSPWSNKFHPHLEDGMYPSEELRKLEVEANEVFTIYRDQYYEGGISSVYLWEEDDNEGFVACFLIKKDGSKYAHGRRGYLHEGGWEAIHVIQVGPDEEGMAHYCLTSTIMLSLTTDSDTSGTFNLSGSIRRQMKADLSVEDGHLCNMGKMIEELEGKLRNQLDQVYFGKTKEMVCTLRPPSELLSMTLPDSRNP